MLPISFNNSLQTATYIMKALTSLPYNLDDKDTTRAQSQDTAVRIWSNTKPSYIRINTINLLNQMVGAYTAAKTINTSMNRLTACVTYR